MTRVDTRSDLVRYGSVLAQIARMRYGIPESLAEDARRITVAALVSGTRPSSGGVEAARVRAYFWAVIRRRALRSPAASEFVARMVRESIAQDLRRDGWCEEAIGEELARAAS